MEKTLCIIFGNSWRTSLLGYLAAIAQVVYPLMTAGTISWKAIGIAALTAIIGRIVKDANSTGKDSGAGLLGFIWFLGFIGPVLRCISGGLRTLITLIALITLLTFAPCAFAASNITFAWDPVDCANIKIYQSEISGTFDKKTTPIVGTIACPATSLTVIGIADGTHHWAATASDAAGNESDFSKQVSATLDTIPPAVPAGFKITVVTTISVTQ